MNIKNVKLKDVCDLITCGVAKRPDYTDTGIPFLSSRNVKKQKIIWDNFRFISLKTHKKLTQYNKPNLGDILYTRVGSYGEAAVVDKDIEFSVFVSLTLIKPKKNFIHNKYLVYFLNSPSGKLLAKNGINSSGVGNLNVSVVRDFTIPLPPLTEQQRIVAKLDVVFCEIDKEISLTQKSIDDVNLLFEEKIKQYFINNVTNSPLVKLSDISEYFNGLTYSPKDISEDGTIVLRSGNIQNGKMEYSDIKRVSKKIKDKLYVKSTDILICSRNGSQRLIGKSSLIGEIKEPMTFGTFMMILRSKHNRYLQWFIKSKLFKKQILKGENTMINQITRYMLDDITLPFPDKKIYSKIANELEELDGHIRMLNKILNTKIDNFKKLKFSILKQELEYKST